MEPCKVWSECDAAAAAPVGSAAAAAETCDLIASFKPSKNFDNKELGGSSPYSDVCARWPRALPLPLHWRLCKPSHRAGTSNPLFPKCHQSPAIGFHWHVHRRGVEEGVGERGLACARANDVIVVRPCSPLPPPQMPPITCHWVSLACAQEGSGGSVGERGLARARANDVIGVHRRVRPYSPAKALSPPSRLKSPLPSSLWPAIDATGQCRPPPTSGVPVKDEGREE